MIAIPAIDLRAGACVQLVGGSYDDERVRLDDPVAVLSRWNEFGFRRTHVVDLDAATGRGNNTDVIRELLRAANGTVQVGGGVRSEARVAALVDDGADFVVVGTRAIEDPHWLAEVAHAYPGLIIVAADVRGRHVLTRGWQEATTRDVTSFIDGITELPLAGVLVTAVHKEGLMQGADVHLMEDVVASSHVPVYASGGIGGRSDLDALASAGVAGAVIGMALYTGALEPQLLVEEYGA